MQSSAQLALQKYSRALKNEQISLKRKRPSPCIFSTKCQICGAQRHQSELRNVRIWSDKLLVLLASLTRKDLGIERIRELSASPTVFYVCCTHLIHTCQELFTMLGARTPFEIPDSDQDLVTKAMETVESFRTGRECLPIVSNWHFLQCCYSFLVKHWHDSAKVPLPVNGKIRYHFPTKPAEIHKNTFRCRICTSAKHPSCMTHLKNRIEKLLVMIHAIHRKDLTISIAKLLFPLPTFLCCKIHLLEAGKHVETMIREDSEAMESSELRKIVVIDDMMDIVVEIVGEQAKLTKEAFSQHVSVICTKFSTGSSKKTEKSTTIPNSSGNSEENVQKTANFCQNELIDSSDIEFALEEVVEMEERVKENEETENEETQTEKAAEKGKSGSSSTSSTSSSTHFPLIPPSLLPTCRICEKHTNNVQFVTLGVDKLLLLLISIHRNHISKETAQKLCQLPTLFACNDHLIDSCRDLSEMLGISRMSAENDNFPVLGAKKVKNVLELANSLKIGRFPLSEGGFVDLCRQFWDKFGALNSGERATQSCRLCGLKKRESEVNRVTVLSEKMIVLVTEVSRGAMTKTSARQYFSESRELLVCQWHLVDVCKRLCTMFRVPRPESFIHPKKHLIDHAMTLVSQIQKGRFPFATTDGKHFVQQCQRFTNKYWNPKMMKNEEKE